VSKTPAQRVYEHARDIFAQASPAAPKRLLRDDAIEAFVELAAVRSAPRTQRLADELREQAVALLREHGDSLGPRVVARFARECTDLGASRPRYVSAVPLPELWDSIVTELASARTTPLRANG
jgi:hypothetical protein